MTTTANSNNTTSSFNESINKNLFNFMNNTLSTNTKIASSSHSSLHRFINRRRRSSSTTGTSGTTGSLSTDYTSRLYSKSSTQASLDLTPLKLSKNKINSTNSSNYFFNRSSCTQNNENLNVFNMKNGDEHFNNRVNNTTKPILLNTSIYYSNNKKQSSQIYDRYIPSHVTSNLTDGFAVKNSVKAKRSATSSTAAFVLDEFGSPVRNRSTSRSSSLMNNTVTTTVEYNDSSKNFRRTRRRTLRFNSPRKPCASPRNNPYSLCPISDLNRRLFNNHTTQNECVRNICRAPYKVLDAPSLQDDFYLNLVDQSAENMLAVGLGSSVYLQSSKTGKVTCLYGNAEDSEDLICSVGQTEKGNYLAVGLHNGEIQIQDAVTQKLVRLIDGHKSRVGSLSQNGNILASGSRDRLVLLRDLRNSDNSGLKFQEHKQEVCGLKQSLESDKKQLASGGNDNKLLIWDLKSTKPILIFDEHKAAVKAISQSPHQPGLIASGGGTADRSIRFQNTLSTDTKSLYSLDTGSQVCNLAWSKNVDEIVSTHGYSLNQIIVQKYDTPLVKLATLVGHTYRVLYLSCSPDGQTIVTGAGDETLRFQNIFPSYKASICSSHLGSRPKFSNSISIR